MKRWQISRQGAHVPVQGRPRRWLQMPRNLPEKIHFMGLVLAHASGGFIVRGAIHRATLTPDEGRHHLQAVPHIQTQVGMDANQGRAGLGIGGWRSPPQEIRGALDVINFVNSTTGAIGYISGADIQPGSNGLLKQVFAQPASMRLCIFRGVVSLAFVLRHFMDLRR